MKKMLYLCFLLVSLCALNSKAQDKSKHNIAMQPLWGPTGYNHVDYYFLPDIGIYYSVNDQKFIYLNNGKWEFTPVLPAIYSNYDLYAGYKVVINRPNPYTNFRAHKVRYANYASQKNRQTTISQSDNPKYYVVQGHPKNMPAEESQIGYTPKIK